MIGGLQKPTAGLSAEYSWFERLILSFSSVSFVLLSYALIELVNSQRNDYELSIYSSTSSIFWIAVSACLASGFLIIFFDLHKRSSRFWIMGIFIIVFINCLILSLYALRGYYINFGNGDASSYVGIANDLRIYGNIQDYDFYPFLFLLIDSFNLLTGVRIIEVANSIVPLIFVIYILSIYCWSKSILSIREYILSCVLAATPLFFAGFYVSANPQVLSTLLIPLLLYSAERSSIWQFKSISIILALVFPFFHPITAIFLYVYLIIFFISGKFYSHISQERRSISFNLAFIYFIALSVWFVFQFSLLRSIRSILLQLINGAAVITSYDRGAYYLDQLGLLKAFTSLIFMTLDESIYYAISLASIYYFYKYRRELEPTFAPIMGSFLAGSILLAVLFFFSNIHLPDRMINLNPNIMLSIPLVGFMLCRALSANNAPKRVLAFLFVLIVASSTMISLYPSPFIQKPNEETTDGEILGAKWLIDNKNQTIYPIHIQTPIYRYADMLYGIRFRSAQGNLIYNTTVTNHFGISNSTAFPLNASLSAIPDVYVAISAYDIQAYSILWSNLNKFNKNDFIQIDHCGNVNKIYMNGDIISYLVHR